MNDVWTVHLTEGISVDAVTNACNGEPYRAAPAGTRYFQLCDACVKKAYT